MSGSRGGAEQGRLHQKVVHQVQEYLAWCSAWQVKIHGGAYQRPGLLDLLACLEGRMVAIEVKTGAAELTKTQQEQWDGLEAAGALCILAHEVEDVEVALLRAGLLAAPRLVPEGAGRGWRGHSPGTAR